MSQGGRDLTVSIAFGEEADRMVVSLAAEGVSWSGEVMRDLCAPAVDTMVACVQRIPDALLDADDDDEAGEDGAEATP